MHSYKISPTCDVSDMMQTLCVSLLIAVPELLKMLCILPVILGKSQVA